LATHKLAKWYRFLPSGDTQEQQKIQDRIAARFKELGGMTDCGTLEKDRFLAGFRVLPLLPFATTRTD